MQVNKYEPEVKGIKLDSNNLEYNCMKSGVAGGLL